MFDPDSNIPLLALMGLAYWITAQTMVRLSVIIAVHSSQSRQIFSGLKIKNKIAVVAAKVEVR